MNILCTSEIINNLNKVFSLPNLSYAVQQLPCFPIHSSQIRVLRHPKDFYSKLVSHASIAQKRVVIASLYLGNGRLEKKLISTIDERVRRCSSLRVQWLLDFTRASRGRDNSRTLLQPLIGKGHSSTQVSLFHSPLLRGVKRRLLPERWNEVIGLQHMKVYIFDDSVIISGANLSNDYFTNRQDRYFVVENAKDLADFYEGLVDLVSKYSFRLNGDDSVQMSSSDNAHPYKGPFQKYCNEFRADFDQFWQNELLKSQSRINQLIVDFTRSETSPCTSSDLNSSRTTLNYSNSPDLSDMNPKISHFTSYSEGNVKNRRSPTQNSILNHSSVLDNLEISKNKNIHKDRNLHISSDRIQCFSDTLIFPTVQIPFCGVEHDSKFTLGLIQDCPERSSVNLATGYFNLTEQYMMSMLSESKASFDVLCAHPTANGFLGAKGFAGGIPAAYTKLCRNFFERVKSWSMGDRIKFLEYQQQGWTFHGKGLWYFPPGDTSPSSTLIGSPNFGYRSVHRDLESQLIVATFSSKLRETLREESEHLFSTSSSVKESTYLEPDRKVPLWVKLFTVFFKYYF